jgi:flagellar basal body rod protein FlgC
MQRFNALKRLFKRDAVKANNSVTTNEHISIWEDTGQVYYLENTLKVCYESNSGRITLEKLSLKDLSDVIQAIESLTADSPMAQAHTAQQKSAFNISVCGITWQKNRDNMRIKAIAQAALLRSQTSCFTRSQAVFRHAALLEHDDLISSVAAQPKPGQFIYNGVSVQQFTQQISDANARITPSLKRSITIKAENFDTTFTEHESAAFEQLLKFDNHSSEDLISENKRDLK